MQKSNIKNAPKRETVVMADPGIAKMFRSLAFEEQAKVMLELRNIFRDSVDAENKLCEEQLCRLKEISQVFYK